MSLSTETRLSRLETFVDWAKPLLEEIAKQLELSRPRINPKKYCKDELDRKIINYLIENKGAGTTELAEALNLEDPKLVGRHLIGKRLKRLKDLSDRDGWHILEFHPETKEGKFRAWWILIEDIDLEAFRRT